MQKGNNFSFVSNVFINKRNNCKKPQKASNNCLNCTFKTVLTFFYGRQKKRFVGSKQNSSRALHRFQLHGHKSSSVRGMQPQSLSTTTQNLPLLPPPFSKEFEKRENGLFKSVLKNKFYFKTFVLQQNCKRKLYNCVLFCNRKRVANIKNLSRY